MRPVRQLSLRALLLVGPVVLAALAMVLWQASQSAADLERTAHLAGEAARAEVVTDSQAVLTVKTDQLLALRAFGPDTPSALESRVAGAEAMAASLDSQGLLAALRVTDERAAELRDELARTGIEVPPALDRAMAPLGGAVEAELAAGTADLDPKPYASSIDWLGTQTAAARDAGRAAQQQLLADAGHHHGWWRDPQFLAIVVGLVALGAISVVLLRRSIERSVRNALVEREILSRKNDQLERLFGVVRRLNSTLDIGEIAKTTVEQAAMSAESQFALLTLVEGHELVPAAMIGPVPGARVAAYHGLCGRVIDAGQPLRAVVPGEPVLGAIKGPFSLVAAPIVSGGHVIGVLIAGRTGDGSMTDDAEMALQYLALCAGPAIDAARQHGSTAELALVDALTGLHNKRRLDQDLTNVVARCAREHRPVSFMMIDVDHFKQYNDTYGHPAGDAALRRVAGIVRSCVREHDTVYRFGGEEIAVLLPSTHLADALAVAERVRATVAIDAEPGTDTDRRITVSVGLACTITHDVVELLSQADLALYEAKRSGRNRVVSTDVGGETTAKANAPQSPIGRF